MPIYTVRNAQTLFDIAVQLYGTVEGIFDLLISNPHIGMTTQLKSGDKLEYHDSFIINKGIVSKLSETNTTIANGERHTYYKPIDKDLVAIIKTPPSLDICEFAISGDGNMYIDWGDNTSIEEVRLKPTTTLLSHYFDNNVDERKIFIYGDFNIKHLSLSRLNGELYMTRPLVVDEFECQANNKHLQGLFLFKDTYSVNLANMTISDLSPIYDMSLQELNLSGAIYPNPDILLRYFQHIRDNYGQRRACKVYLDNKPSKEILQIIDDILLEPEWNTPQKWEFYFGQEKYEINNGENSN